MLAETSAPVWHETRKLPGADDSTADGSACANLSRSELVDCLALERRSLHRESCRRRSFSDLDDGLRDIPPISSRIWGLDDDNVGRVRGGGAWRDLQAQALRGKSQASDTGTSSLQGE